MFLKPMLILLVSLLLLISFTACGKSPEQKDARKELEQMNIQYNDLAFFGCAEKGNTVAVGLFLDAGMNPDAKRKNGRTALMSTARFGHTDTAEALLARGADVNAKTNEGWTALMDAAWKGHTDTLQALLARGADVNAKDKHTARSDYAKSDYGKTALMFAALLGRTDSMEALLAKGADVNAKDNDGVTALMRAQKKGYTKIAQFLKDAGAKE